MARSGRRVERSCILEDMGGWIDGFELLFVS